MWRIVYDWVNYSFKVWFALLTAQILIFVLFFGGYTFCLLGLYLLGLLWRW